LNLCLNGYILLQTPSLEVFPWWTWVTISLNLLGLAEMSYDFFTFKDDYKDGILKWLFKKIGKCLQKPRVHRLSKIQEEAIKPIKMETKTDIFYAPEEKKKDEQKFKGWIKSLSYVLWEKCKGWIKSLSYVHVLVQYVLFPIFFSINGCFNVLTMVLLVNVWKKTNDSPKSIFLTIWLAVCFALLILFFWMTLKKNKITHFFLSTFYMVWSNLFTFTVPLSETSTVPLTKTPTVPLSETPTVPLSETPHKETHQVGANQDNINATVWLQMGHYIFNMTVFLSCVSIEPKDYIFIPENVHIVYVALGSFSSLFMCAHLFLTCQKQIKDETLSKTTTNDTTIEEDAKQAGTSYIEGEEITVQADIETEETIRQADITDIEGEKLTVQADIEREEVTSHPAN